jgi:glycosyltransferase involved in cell wall biosynthesis
MQNTVSFVIYFHSSRLDNLCQSIRFLENREPDLLGSELFLLCHDNCEKIDTKFAVNSVYNFGDLTYNKAKFCNYGVQNASGSVIVLLDSDRILPHGYFHKCVNGLRPKQFITTKYLYDLAKPYSDYEIESNHIDKVQDYRSIANVGRSKNLFSGNTVFYKNDYLATDGMDETFSGYGFTDNYQTHNIISKGYEQVYLDDDELHLYHHKNVYWKGQKVDNFKIMTAINAVKYFKKCKLPIDRESSILLHEVRNSLHLFPQDLVDIFRELDTRKFL